MTNSPTREPSGLAALNAWIRKPVDSINRFANQYIHFNLTWCRDRSVPLNVRPVKDPRVKVTVPPGATVLARGVVEKGEAVDCAVEL